MSKK
jgi:hypothetical protein